MKRFLLIIACVCFLLAQVTSGADAVENSPVSPFGLKLAPLQVRTELEKGKNKKGFIDVSNPTTETIDVTTSVRAFRQVNDNGALEFYENEQVRLGLRLDLDSFTLPPKSALRMYYLLDSTKLPSGDVFAAIFFTTNQKASLDTAVKTSIRVGTLLSVVNGAPGPRDAEIVSVSVPWLQFNTISGDYRIKNTTNLRSATGFYPKVTISTAPVSNKFNHDSSLLFAGRTRVNSFSYNQSLPGIYRVRVQYGQSFKDSYVLVVTPIAGGILILIIMILGGLITLRRKMIRSSRRPKTKRSRLR